MTLSESYVLSEPQGQPPGGYNTLHFTSLQHRWEVYVGSGYACVLYTGTCHVLYERQSLLSAARCLDPPRLVLLWTTNSLHPTLTLPTACIFCNASASLQALLAHLV